LCRMSSGARWFSSGTIWHCHSNGKDAGMHCFLPASVPVEWQFQIVPLDRQRAPEDIRHK